MNTPHAELALPRWMRSWEEFWFRPLDPTQLAAIRILCGLITLYTFIVYGLTLEDTVGADGWISLKMRQDFARDRPVQVANLHGDRPVIKPANAIEEGYVETFRRKHLRDLRIHGLPPPKDKAEWNYLEEYFEKYQQLPPAYAKTTDEARSVDKCRAFLKDKAKENAKNPDEVPYLPDPRINGLRPPMNQEEFAYCVDYTIKWSQPPPAYARSAEEAKAIDDYRAREEVDPRNLYARGAPIWSLWMHVTDPIGMRCVQALFCVSAFLFVIGLGTRVTSALTWIASLSYIHRNTQIVFGVDTMMAVLLLYLTIGPSGAALSVDRLLGRWWRGENGPAKPPAPSVTANFAIRLLQIHICIIYLVAGIAKLQGTAWWNGTALWAVVANYEFAPMQFGIYNDILRLICRNQFVWESVMTGGCYFTLVFEISYMFLVWHRRTRWVALGGAILLHGTIGMFMGLKTFSMAMLVMNMAFVRPEEVRWVLQTVGGWFGPSASAGTPALQAVAASKE